MGSLSINDHQQLIQRINHANKYYPSPHLQVQLQVCQLRTLINEPLAIHPLVVFTHPDASLNFEYNPDLITLQALSLRMNELMEEYSNCESTTNIKQLAFDLKSKHSRKHENLYNHYQLSKNQLISGVFCIWCSEKKTLMTRTHGTWQCPSCGRLDKLAHIEALKDYGYLINRLINNEEARSFLRVNSRFTVSRLLNDLKLEKIGEGKGTKYDLTKLL
ncbi:hypothetical protein SAMN04488134_105131 [Amphibacillus marinus]|uniref:Nuclease-related domain-containing protein n=2 Tax=Amphibacillus marinus TaxID=872970 RepID=A0A1H8N5B7_9BACI|nr:hypothetical protein SAMN04488134_105131 [Amphibacillus marinus]